jgi:tetratricopeptide (TPR) repeat protein
VYPETRVARFVTENFAPVRLHVRDQAGEFKRAAERFQAPWTPTILVLDPDGKERHRVEGFLEADEFLAQLMLGLARHAFEQQEWDDAERRFREIVKELPNTEAAPEALYWAGVSRYKGSNDGAALAETAKAFGERYRDSSWAKKASVWKG